MLLGDDVQAAEHDGQDLVDVLLYEAENVLVVPEVQRPLCYLPGRTHTHIHTVQFQLSLCIFFNSLVPP